MKPEIQDILQLIETFAPAELAEKWDNVGLLVGDPHREVDSIIIGLDPTNRLVDEALSVGADTIITHHPVIFHPLSAIHTNNAAGKLLQKALANNLNIIACHTNLDSAEDGVNDVLAKALGLDQLIPLQPNGDDKQQGLGRVGVYHTPVSRNDFLKSLFTVLDLQTINVAGTIPQQISKVALCGGSGSDLASLALASGADLYLSAEIKHSTAIWANEVGFAIIDGTHYATEKPVTSYLARKLEKIIEQQQWHTIIQLTKTEQHPFVSENRISTINSKT